MVKHLLLAAPAAEPAPPGFLNNTGIQGIIAFVVFLVLSLVAVKLFMGSGKGDVRGAANTGVVVFIGCVILALAGSALWVSIGQGALDTLFSG